MQRGAPKTTPDSESHLQSSHSGSIIASQPNRNETDSDRDSEESGKSFNDSVRQLP